MDIKEVGWGDMDSIDLAQDRDDLTREWRRLHNEELHDLYYSPNIVGVISPRRMD
jgi:hypothetical protein